MPDIARLTTLVVEQVRANDLASGFTNEQVTTGVKALPESNAAVTLAPSEIDKVEALAAHLTALVARARQKATAEAVPTRKLADYPLTRADLQQVALPSSGSSGWRLDLALENMVGAMASCLSSAVPMMTGLSSTIRGAAKNEDGGYTALIAVHQFMTPPTNESTHYACAVDATGARVSVERVKVA